MIDFIILLLNSSYASTVQTSEQDLFSSSSSSLVVSGRNTYLDSTKSHFQRFVRGGREGGTYIGGKGRKSCYYNLPRWLQVLKYNTFVRR